MVHMPCNFNQWVRTKLPFKTLLHYSHTLCNVYLVYEHYQIECVMNMKMKSTPKNIYIEELGQRLCCAYKRIYATGTASLHVRQKSCQSINFEYICKYTLGA